MDNESKTKILHVIPDEKFTPYYQSKISENLTIENRFRIIVRSTGNPLKFAKYTDNTLAEDDSYWISSRLGDDLNWCDILIVHYLHPRNGIACIRAPHKVVIIWSGWGRDYLRYLFKNESSYLQPKTLRLIAKLNSNKSVYNKLLSHFRIIVRSFLYHTLFGLIMAQAIKRVDYFCSPTTREYQSLKDNVKGFNADFIQIDYVDIDYLFPDGGIDCCGNNILVGNSATPENNHLEVFDLLKNMPLSGRQIIIPLTYGDNYYGAEIDSTARAYFGESALPLTSHLPLDEYNKIITSCSIIIMNHIRQQAGGNILTGLYSGAKVFLNSKSPFYNKYKEAGVYIYKIPESTGDLDCFFESLTRKQQATNREILTRMYGKAAIEANISVITGLKGNRK